LSFGRNESLLHVNDVRVDFRGRRCCRTRSGSLAELKRPAFASCRQKDSVDLTAMECAIDLKTSAAHWTGGNHQGIMTWPVNFWHSENHAGNVLRFRSAEAFARSAGPAHANDP